MGDSVRDCTSPVKLNFSVGWRIVISVRFRWEPVMDNNWNVSEQKRSLSVLCWWSFFYFFFFFVFNQWKKLSTTLALLSLVDHRGVVQLTWDLLIFFDGPERLRSSNDSKSECQSLVDDQRLAVFVASIAQFEHSLSLHVNPDRRSILDVERCSPLNVITFSSVDEAGLSLCYAHWWSDRRPVDVISPSLPLSLYEKKEEKEEGLRSTKKKMWTTYKCSMIDWFHHCSRSKTMKMFLLQSLALIVLLLVATSHSLPPINFSSNVLTNRMIEALSEALVARDRLKTPSSNHKNRDQYQPASPYQQLFIDQYYQQQPPPAYEPQLPYYPPQTFEQQPQAPPAEPQPSYPQYQYVPQPPAATEQHVYPQHVPEQQYIPQPQVPTGQHVYPPHVPAEHQYVPQPQISVEQHVYPPHVPAEQQYVPPPQVPAEQHVYPEHVPETQPAASPGTVSEWRCSSH